MNTESVIKLGCNVQTYHWGRKGEESMVANLMAESNADFSVESEKTYAELWMGAHPKGPSTCLLESNLTLDKYIEKHPECLGSNITELFGESLPFLFKVLSVSTSLSIQTHPNKKNAEMLHRTKPELYPDPNHKPEMAIALTDFEVLCGFRPMKEISHFIRNIPQLANLIDSSCVQMFEQGIEYKSTEEKEKLLSTTFRSLITSDRTKVREEVDSLLKSFDGMNEDAKESFECELVKRLNVQYPGDIGCFVVYLLNHIFLKPGEAVFLEAELPHAYLHGDCIECMACSDNVIRAGLTPKYIDVDTLCKFMSYKSNEVEELLFQPIVLDEHNLLYKPNIPDFAVIKSNYMKNSNRVYEMPVLQSASIILVIDGEVGCEVKDKPELAFKLSKGNVFFVSTSTSLVVRKIVKDTVLFRAFCP